MSLGCPESRNARRATGLLMMKEGMLHRVQEVLIAVCAEPGHSLGICWTAKGKPILVSYAARDPTRVFLGETMCLPCEPGRVADVRGACQPCGNGTAWTTSRVQQLSSGNRWVVVEGADSYSFCRCAQDFFLHDAGCYPCSEGTNCPGSNELELLPGFFSSTENPGSVFRCYGDESRCPGGPPGSCASGRDNRSLACGACLEGLRAAGASCEQCGDGDYILSVLTGLVILLGTGCLHFMLLRQDKEHYIKAQTQAGLLNASVFASQLVVCLQLLA